MVDYGWRVSEFSWCSKLLAGAINSVVAGGRIREQMYVCKCVHYYQAGFKEHCDLRKRFNINNLSTVVLPFTIAHLCTASEADTCFSV